MTMDLVARTQYVKEVKELTARCQSKLESLVSSIGWTLESLNRIAPQDSSCLNEAENQGTVPQPATQEGNPQLEDFEKRYNDLLSGLPTHPKKDRQKSEEQALVELLEFERNAKRRRVSYKNKVHTKNKSHTEVLRELVREQMEVLKEISGEMANEETEPEKPVAAEEDSVGLIQLNLARGNPHAMWRKIGQLVENSSGEKRPPKADRDALLRHSRERPSKPYERGDRSSWRCHDDRDDRHSKDRRKRDSDRSYSKNRNDYDRRKHKSSKRRSRSPCT